jgi:Na+/H+ antiporter NhaC
MRGTGYGAGGAIGEVFFYIGAAVAAGWCLYALARVAVGVLRVWLEDGDQ